MPTLVSAQFTNADGTTTRSANGTWYVTADTEAKITCRGKANTVSVTYTDSTHKQLLAERKVSPSAVAQELTLPLATPPRKEGWLVLYVGFVGKNGDFEANSQTVHVIWE